MHTCECCRLKCRVVFFLGSLEFCPSCWTFKNRDCRYIYKQFLASQVSSFNQSGGDSEMSRFVIKNGESSEWVRLEVEGHFGPDTFKAYIAMLGLVYSGDNKKYRRYDPVKKVNYIHTDSVDMLLKGLETLTTAYGLKPIKDDRTKPMTTEAFEEFFNTPPPRSSGPAKTRAELIKAFENLIKDNEIYISIREDIDKDSAKKIYRRAAIMLHPDRNGGDGTKMSELNMIWNQLQEML